MSDKMHRVTIWTNSSWKSEVLRHIIVPSEDRALEVLDEWYDKGYDGCYFEVEERKRDA